MSWGRVCPKHLPTALGEWTPCSPQGTVDGGASEKGGKRSPGGLESSLGKGMGSLEALLGAGLAEKVEVEGQGAVHTVLWVLGSH